MHYVIKLKDMEIKIVQNDYVQPTEVRKDVVQTLCDIMCSFLDVPRSITIHAKQAELYVGKSKLAEPQGENPIVTRSTLNKSYEYTRVHSCEMEEAFKVFQDAGYFIYLERDKKTKSSTYRFSKKPVLDGVQNKNLEFDVFID